jgi:hypothetical protein
MIILGRVVERKQAKRKLSQWRVNKANKNHKQMKTKRQNCRQKTVCSYHLIEY